MDMEIKHRQELDRIQTEFDEMVRSYQSRIGDKEEELSRYSITLSDKKDIYDEYDVLRFLNACKTMVNDDRYDRHTRPLKKPRAEVAIRAFKRFLALMDEEETYMRENRSDYEKAYYDGMREAIHYYISRFSDEEWVKALPKKILKPNEIRALEEKERD